MTRTFPKRVLFYGLLTLLTLLAIEGMARIAYYAAYGQGYGSGPPDLPVKLSPINDRVVEPFQLRHPFYGYTKGSPYDVLNAMPPQQRREELVIIGLLGGSVAEQVQPALQRALNRYFVATNQPRQPVVVGLANGGVKHPQQAIIVANNLLLGGEFDIIVNLDGLNEIARSAGQNPQNGIFPFFPLFWKNLVGLSTEAERLAGKIGLLRREQARLAAAGETTPLRRSAVFGIINRYQQERIARQIVLLNHELAATRSAYSLERYGPRIWPEGEAELLPETARGWYRGSVALARLSELAGADYYHFLQPNQYVPDSKPLSAAELASAYAPDKHYKSFIERGYPLLQQLSQALPSQGVHYFDLTGIFAAHPETLYTDTCCHLNTRGNELLAAAMVQRMEPALLRRAARPAGAPVSALAAARSPIPPDTLLVDAAFQVYLDGNKQWLRYVREDCALADVEPRFFLHLTPRDLTDLPPYRREHGFDNRDFSFAETGGFLWQGQCQTQFRLPGYPIAALRTGQYAAGAGELWAEEFSFPE